MPSKIQSSCGSLFKEVVHVMRPERRPITTWRIHNYIKSCKKWCNTTRINLLTWSITVQWLKVHERSMRACFEDPFTPGHRALYSYLFKNWNVKIDHIALFKVHSNCIVLCCNPLGVWICVCKEFKRNSIATYCHAL